MMGSILPSAVLSDERDEGSILRNPTGTPVSSTGWVTPPVGRSAFNTFADFDPVMTPRPLQIIKRLEFGNGTVTQEASSTKINSTSVVSGRSKSISPAMIPQRESSVVTAAKIKAIDSPDRSIKRVRRGPNFIKASSPETSPPARVEESQLSIRKQRRSNPIRLHFLRTDHRKNLIDGSSNSSPASHKYSSRVGSPSKGVSLNRSWSILSPITNYLSSVETDY